ncbi:MAG: cyclic lactone autoinducer peptide [Peptostreptococcaceae bacterium]|jgi:hypothetical protein|nr:cyclic lactone autoinducer peptide [Peptostreptococcaceae bacterium]
MKNIAKKMLKKVVKGLNTMAYSTSFSCYSGHEEPKMPKCMLKK